MSEPGDELNPLECTFRNLAAVTDIDRARITHALSQEFLADLWLQKRKAAIEAGRYRELEEFALKALRSGAVVEPGLHNVRIVEGVRKAHRVRGSRFSRLIVE